MDGKQIAWPDIAVNISGIWPGTSQKEEKGKIHIWSVGYQNSVKRVIGVHF